MESSTTQKTVFIIIFVIVGVAVIAGAVWYANNVLNAQPSAVMTAQAQCQPQTQNQTTTITMDGLKITDTTVGTGAIAQNGDTVTVNYTGTFDDGKVFDSSLNPGRTPFSFVLGAGQVIKGWDEGVLGMCVGGTRALVIPASLGYGAAGRSGIPPNATLHFTVELLGVSSTAQ